MLSGSALKVRLVGGVVAKLITLSTTTRVEVELGCCCGWALTINGFLSLQLQLRLELGLGLRLTNNVKIVQFRD